MNRNKELAGIRNTVQMVRLRNYSYKNERIEMEHQKYPRRKSFLLSEIKQIIDDPSASKKQIKQKFQLPHIKMESSIPLAMNFAKISKHYRLSLKQYITQSDWSVHFITMWDFHIGNKDIFDELMEILNMLGISQKYQKECSDICFYDKLLLTIGFELHKHDLYVKFYSHFILAYQTLLLIISLQTSNDSKTINQVQSMIGLEYSALTAEQLQPLLYSKTKQLGEIVLVLSTVQMNSAIGQVLKRCKPGQQYNLNIRIIRKYLALWLHETRNAELINNLPKALLSALPPYISQDIPKPILIIDLDETLVHYDSKSSILLIRNFALDFLQKLHQFYFIAIWTAGLPKYAKWALKRIDNKIDQYIDMLMTREYCIVGDKGAYLKPLHLLGQDLNKILIIDNDPRSVIASEMDYSLIIEAFIEESKDDQALLHLSERILKAYYYYTEGYCLFKAVRRAFVKQ